MASVAKVIELLAEGETIEKATQNAVDQAAKSIDHIQSVYISDFQAILDEAGTIDSYRINAKVTFVVED